MKLIIGTYVEGRLTVGYNEEGEVPPAYILQELKGRFTESYKETNMQLTAKQLQDAATPDQDLIQAIHSLSGLDTTLNTLSKYVSEWHGLHNPLDTATWQEAAEKHQGEEGIGSICQAALALAQQRESLLEYIETQAKNIMPSASAVAGALLAAKLLSEAGSLARLARLPSSTVQLLGAERALFRHLRDRRSLPPKHGIIISHDLVQRAARKGKAARVLANAIAIGVKVDYNKGTPIGEELRKRVEVQLGRTR